VGDVVQTAKELVSVVTGLRAETVTGVRRDGDDGWLVIVEMLELERVPNTMDVLGSYEVTLSADGELVGLRRLGRHSRSATDEGRD
jgi:hypothetical protein